MVVGLGGQRVDVDAAVHQPPRNGHDGAVLGAVIADDAGHVGDARQHAGAVGVAQPPLDPQPVGQPGVQVGVVLQVFMAEQFHFLRLQRRYVGIIHRQAPFPWPVCIFIRACGVRRGTDSGLDSSILEYVLPRVKKNLKKMRGILG